jgi:cytochrome P450
MERDANNGNSIAGTHTTSATTTLLLYHLLHAPETLAKCVSEIDDKLKPLEEGQAAYSVTEVETSLPYLRQCVRENFRITPVFTMPLARRVVAPERIVIAGRHLKQGVSHGPFAISICHVADSTGT